MNATKMLRAVTTRTIDKVRRSHAGQEGSANLLGEGSDRPWLGSEMLHAPGQMTKPVEGEIRPAAPRPSGQVVARAVGIRLSKSNVNSARIHEMRKFTTTQAGELRKALEATDGEEAKAAEAGKKALFLKEKGLLRGR